MIALTVRLPESLVTEIEAEARGRGCSKSAIVRERLLRASTPRPILGSISDLIGSIDGLPADLSQQKKRYLKASYGR
jgi:Ribbon-helix-helix protein, copG family